MQIKSVLEMHDFSGINRKVQLKKGNSSKALAETESEAEDTSKYFYMPGVAKGMSRKDFFPGPFKNFLFFYHLSTFLWFPYNTLGFFRVTKGSFWFLKFTKGSSVFLRIP